MCTLIALHRCLPAVPLAVAANRDEYLDRPAEGPALRRFGGRDVVAPLDLRAGGTWLGLNDAGLFAGITNRPTAQPDPARRSRGLLVADVLAEGSAADAARRLSELAADAYNPFNLFVADGRDAFVAVYDGKPQVRRLAPGAHVIGNHDPDDRTIGKVARLLDEVAGLAGASPEAALSGLVATCRSHEGPVSPLEKTCIHAGGYGTRSSTILLRGEGGAADALRFAPGPPCENAYIDCTPLLRRLGTPAPAATGAIARSPS
jgi:uncharacterized protein with NRDE domain